MGRVPFVGLEGVEGLEGVGELFFQARGKRRFENHDEEEVLCVSEL